MVKKNVDNSFWLICPNWVEVLRFSKNLERKDGSSEYMYIDQGIAMGTFGEKAPLMKNRREMKINEARIYWQKLITAGWQVTEPKW